MSKFDYPAHTILDGRKTVAAAGTAEQLSSTSVEVVSVVIQAETDNTGLVVVGGSDVVAALATRKGIALDKGDTVILEVANLNLIYLDVITNGDGVTYTALA